MAFPSQKYFVTGDSLGYLQAKDGLSFIFHLSALDLTDYGRYLNFEGVEMLQEGKYATSIPLEYALDYKNDVMLAFGMNGRVLHPDHGYVRIRCR